MPASARRNHPDEHLTDAELNELVDGTLSAPATERARTHLATCADCDERYRTLLATVSALRAAPSLMPRRSFRLTPAQAEQPASAPSPVDRLAKWVLPGMSIIRAATLAVALLLISVTAIDLIIHRESGQESAGPVLMQTAPQNQQSEPPLMQAVEVETEDSIPMTGAVANGGAEDRVAEAPQPSTSSRETAGESVAGQTEAPESAPPAPAAAMPDLESSEAASPALQALPPEATPVVTAPIASPEATPVIDTRSDRGGGSVSRWRIAELGLLLLLLWLGVSWLARARANDPAPPGDVPPA